MGWFIFVSVIWIIIAKLIWGKEIVWQESLIHLVVIVPLISMLYVFIFYQNVSDYQVNHGQITKKVRDHDSYQESYECNCYQSCTGSGNNRTCSQVCQTCYRTVYTVEWYVETTLGNMRLDYDSSYYPSVYLQDDPKNYVEAYVGEPCANTSFFKNYIKAAPDSLFNASKYVVNNTLSTPDYPKIYKIYKFDPVINLNTKVNVDEYRKKLLEVLKNPENVNGANIILVFVNSDDYYKYSLEKNWIGGKLSDLTVIIGTDDDKTIKWTESFTYGLSIGNQLLISVLRDSLTGKELNSDFVVSTITQAVKSNFKRKSSDEFKYLSKSINPSGWQLLFITIMQIIFNFGLTLFFVKNEWRKSYV